MTLSNPQSAFEATPGTDVLSNQVAGLTPSEYASMPPPPVPQAADKRPGLQAKAPSLHQMIGLAKAIHTAVPDAALPPTAEMQPFAASAASDNTTLLQEIQRAAASAVGTVAANSSRGELASVLEGLAKVLRDDESYASISYGDHQAEVAQLKALLMEAQATIIGLLNDRVYDRAKLAKLEAEARFFPDVQAQAHRAANLILQTQEMESQLSLVKDEVERLRTAYVRTQQHSGGWLAKLWKPKISHS